MLEQQRTGLIRNTPNEEAYRQEVRNYCLCEQNTTPEDGYITRRLEIKRKSQKYKHKAQKQSEKNMIEPIMQHAKMPLLQRKFKM